MRNEWIPIDERMPEIGKSVLIAAAGTFPGEDHLKVFVDIGRFEGRIVFSKENNQAATVWNSFTDWFSDGQEDVHVVAWTPLPDLTPVLDLLGLGGDES